MDQLMMTRPDEIGPISTMGKRYLEGDLRQDALSEAIRPSNEGDIADVRSLCDDDVKRWRVEASGVLRRGEVVFGLLAAGASSRMDTSKLPQAARELLAKSGRDCVPQSKALVPVVENRDRVYTFLDLFMHNVQRFAEATNSGPKSLLFVSETNESEISEHLKTQFGDQEELLGGLHKVVQRMEPQIVATLEEASRRRDNFDDQLAWEQACRLSESFAGRQLNVPKPAGHGEFLHQLIASGKAAELIDQGVRYLSVRNIDNVPAVLDDTWLALIGYMEANDVSFLVEVSQRDNKQKGGALIQERGRWRLAEDPSFAGSKYKATDSFYINNAVAIIRLDYLFPIYQTTEVELIEAWRAGDSAQLAAIAERGRRRFPTIIEAKPVTLSEHVVAAITPETNMWESTAITADDVEIHAFGVYSETDAGKGIEHLEEAEQAERANRVRFAPIKKWEDYTDPAKQAIVRHVADRILNRPLL
jgi:hypothetical protein